VKFRKRHLFKIPHSAKYTFPADGDQFRLPLSLYSMNHETRSFS